MTNQKLKHWKYTLLFTGFFALTLFVSSCKKEEDGASLTGDITIITRDVMNLTDSSATCSGEITNDGGNEITQRGICWGTESSPTLDNANVTNEGATTGFFSSELTGLQSGTMYYVRAYATNSTGTKYGNEVTFMTPYRLGDTGPAGGTIFYDKGNDNDGWRYLEAAPEDIGPARWGCASTTLSTFETGIGDGINNTRLMRLSSCNEKGLFINVLDTLKTNGYDDWFLPSRDELITMYENMYVMLEDTTFKSNKAYPSSSENYWWNNERRIWGVDFKNGVVLGYESKNDNFRFRPIRAF